MQPRIGDEPASAPHLVGERAEVFVRRLVDAGLPGDAFGIKAPAFAEGGRVVFLPEARLAFHFLSEGNLQVVTGHRLMRRKRREFIKWTLLQRVGIDEIAALAALGRVPLRVAPRGVSGRDRERNGIDRIAERRQLAEPERQDGIDPVRDLLGLGHQLGVGLGIELRIGAQEGLELGKRARKARLRHHALHFSPDTGHFGEADGVDLFR